MAKSYFKLLRGFSVFAWLLIFLQLLNPALAQQMPAELIIKTKPGKLGSISAMSLVPGSKLARAIPKLNAFAVKLHDNADLQTAITVLKSNPNVTYVGKNHILRIAQIFPNDPYFSTGYDIYGMGIFFTRPQWGLYNDGVNGSYGGTFRADVHAPEAWEITTGDPNVVIAVLDTGVDYTHPDLVDKIWTNSSEIPGNGIDDDHNGYIDDWRGWNFCDPENNDPMDDHTQDGLNVHHGTFVSGIAAASSDNGIGITGVAWGCPVMALKVITGSGYGLEADAAEAVVYAADMGAKVINMSLTGENSPLLKDAIEYAWQKGSLIVAASGNENLSTPTYPASYPHALAVGATNENDQRCTAADWGGGGSNYGDYLQVCAPGNGILSCSDAADPGEYFEFPGTSAAAPFVSGVAALIWSVNPTWTNTQVFNQIVRTADDTMTSGYDIYTGWGRVNAFRALTEIPAVAPSIAAAKQMAINDSVVLSERVLTTSSNEIPGRLYVQDDDYKGGLLLAFSGATPSGLQAGDTVNIFGKLTEVSGELALLNPSVSKSGSANIPHPLVMRNVDLGGGTLGSQIGVVDQYSFPRVMAIGVNNIGLVTETWGKVTAIGFDWFYIDDGSHLDDGSPNVGVYVTCPGMVRPGLNKYVKVTGISSCDIPSGSTVRRRVIRPRTQNDIRIVQ